MGAVDQSDVKATVMGLTSEVTPKWYDKQLAFLEESAVSNAHSNYNLDVIQPCKPETFTDWHDELLVELVEMSKSYRKNELTASGIKRKRSSGLGQTQVTPRQVRRRKARVYGKASKEGLECRGRKNLMAFIRQKTTRQQCRFCGMKRLVYWCTACGEVFCMSAPVGLIIPGSQPPRKFRKDGPFCAHRIHGYTNWLEM